MSLTAFVPARSGSKRMPGKNIALLGGKPLLIWTLEAFVKSKNISKIILSTDSEEYWKIAKNYFGGEKLRLDFREPEDAADQTKIFDYLQRQCQKIFTDNDHTFVMGLPTTPFRNSSHVDQIVALHQRAGKPMFSATEYSFPISFSFHIEQDGNWKKIFDKSPMLSGNTRSQDQQKAYHPNGALYIRAIKDLTSPQLKTLYQDAIPYLMDRRISIDIDDAQDFAIAEAIAKLNFFNETQS